MRYLLILAVLSAAYGQQGVYPPPPGLPSGAALPATCTVGQAFALTSAGTTAVYTCGPTANTWALSPAGASAAGWTDDGTTISAAAGRSVAIGTMVLPIPACSTTPPTTGNYKYQCLGSDKSVYTCANAANCTVSGDWGSGGGAPAGAMTQATPNSAANTVSVSVGTSGTAFAETPVTIDPSTGAIGGTVSFPTMTIAEGGTNATSAVQGAVPNTSSTTASAWTATPTLGVAASASGTQTYANATGSGTFTIGASPSTTTNTLLGPTVVPTTGHLLDCTTSSTTCTLHDSGVVTANVLALNAPAAHNLLEGAGTQAPGVIAPSSQTTYPLFSAGASADPAFRAIAAADLPATVPTCATYTVPYTNAAFLAAASSVPVTLFVLPARGKLIGVNLKHTTAFAGTAVTSTVVSVGDGNTPYNQYGSQFDIFQAVSNTAFQDSAQFKSTTMAASNVVAYFTANTNFGNGSATVLTAGSVAASACWVVLP